MALAAANFAYGFWLFPETLKPELRRPFNLARANPFGAWRTAAAAPGMRRIALVLFLWQLASLVYPLTWSFWGIAQLGWSNQLIGLSFAAVGVVIALSQTFITGPAVKQLGERGGATVGMLGAVAGFVGYALCTSTALAFALMAASCTSRIGSNKAAAVTGGIASASSGVASAPSPEIPPLASPSTITASTASSKVAGSASRCIAATSAWFCAGCKRPLIVFQMRGIANRQTANVAIDLAAENSSLG